MGKRKSVNHETTLNGTVAVAVHSIIAPVETNNASNGIKMSQVPSSSGENSLGRNGNNNNNKTECISETTPNIGFRKEIGLLEGVALIIGSIVGSGIFVTPKGVFQIMHSVGGSLMVWLICGIVSISGALCFVELGTALPKSGGCYFYLMEILGPTVSFMYLWTQMLIFVPAGCAVYGLAFANYVVQIFFPPGCHLPEVALKLIAASAILFLVFLNCCNVRGVTRFQNFLMIAKITPLVFIISVGIFKLAEGELEYLEKPFESTNINPGSISLAFYSGFFAYDGWSVLNSITEEIKNPNKSMPRAIYISLPIVTFIYILANLAYFIVLSPAEVLAADAIAATFTVKILSSYWSFLMPSFVAFSTFGGLSIHLMHSSRQLFVGARYGHCPSILAQINITRFTPQIALIFAGLLSMFYLITSDIYALITYSSYIYNITQVAVIVVIFYVRREGSGYDRPIKVSIIHPIIYSCAILFLVIFPLYATPIESSIGILIGLSGLPVYYLFINGEDKKPSCFNRITSKIHSLTQKLFLCLPEDQ